MRRARMSSMAGLGLLRFARLVTGQSFLASITGTAPASALGTISPPYEGNPAGLCRG